MWHRNRYQWIAHKSLSRYWWIDFNKRSSSLLWRPHRKGLFLAQVGKGSPADKAGIIPGDIVLEFNGKEINAAEELVTVIEKRNPGG
ncbi:MAG: PDZ domain-containing protein [Promethearchaeota archaeon]